MLAALLNGSQFDYIIVASLPNPARIEHVVLIAKADWLEGSDPKDNPVVAVNRPDQEPFQQIVPPAKLAQPQDAAEDIEDDSDQPTTEQISVAQDPPAGDGVVVQPSVQQLSPGQAPQVFPATNREQSAAGQWRYSAAGISWKSSRPPQLTSFHKLFPLVFVRTLPPAIGSGGGHSCRSPPIKGNTRSIFSRTKKRRRVARRL